MSYIEKVYAPMNGHLVSIENVPDPTFSEKLMGDGIAIEPIDGVVTSPVDGEIILVANTKHAIGVKGSSGVELLIHIGLETVALKGEGFTVHVNVGDCVKVGDPLVTFDFDFIKEKAKSMITPIIVTNSDDYKLLSKSNEKNVQRKNTTLLTIEAYSKQDNHLEKVSEISETLYTREAREIIQAIGGKDNIEMATHCVTRLRFVLEDEGKVNKETLNQIDLVKGIFSANGQFQVIIGQGTVDKVYRAMVKETGVREASKDEVKNKASEVHRNALQRGIKILADIFIPILPAIVTAGLLMGLNNILANPGIFGRTSKAVIEMYPEWAGIADMINIIANTAFTFLPALIGWSAVKRFGGSPLLGIVLGLILVHPNLLSAYSYSEALTKGTVPTWNLFGLEINKIGYQGQVLPVLVASWVLAKIEIWLRKHVIDSLQLLIVAPVALLVTGFLSFVIVGPITLQLGNWITNGFVAIFDTVPIIGGLLYGALYAPLVITGMHHTFLAVDLQLIGSTGTTFLWPILALSNIAQGSAAFGMFLAAKNEKLKGLAGTSGISAWLGITEPALFGVNLPNKYPFIAAISGTAIAGAFITLEGVRATSVGVGGIPAFLSIVIDHWGVFFIGMAIVIIVPLVLTYLIAKRKLINQ